MKNLDDSDAVRDVERVKVRRQLAIGLLGSVRSDEGVDLVGLDVVQGVNGGLDLTLVGLDVHDEHQRVVVFDLFHGRLGGEREAYDAVLVQLWSETGRELGGVLWVAREAKRARAGEADARADLGGLSAVRRERRLGRGLSFSSWGKSERLHVDSQE